jgi:RimJ/RimL family protein N-acetyltransferase
MYYANRRHEDRAADHVTLTDKNGEIYLLRPIRPADAPSLMRGYDAMSTQAKWFRMLHTVPHLSEDMAQRFCTPDPQCDLCFVIEGQRTLLGEILGGARIAGEDHGVAEFAVSLRPEAQTLGLAYGALEAVLHAAYQKGFTSVWGTISVHNVAMVALARRIGFNLLPDPDDASLLRADIELPMRNSSVIGLHHASDHNKLSLN